MANFTVHTVAQSLSEDEKAQAKTNIGLPIAAGTVLANPSGVLANPVGVDAAGMRTLIGVSASRDPYVVTNYARTQPTPFTGFGIAPFAVDRQLFSDGNTPPPYGKRYLQQHSRSIARLKHGT